MAELSLDTIAEGAAKELFLHMLEKVAENITDANTDAAPARTFTLEFIFSPFPDRTGALVEIRSKSRLAPVSYVQTTAYFQLKGNRIIAYSENPRQKPLYPEMDVTKPPTQ